MKYSIILLVFLFIFSCEKENYLPTNDIILSKYLNLPNTDFNYSDFSLPSFLNNQFVSIQDNTPTNNPITNSGATLGRVLFYDKNLSFNNKISCSSCHIQEFGFTDTFTFSQGFQGEHTRRHSMSLINARYYLNGRFFWDERASSLEEQVLMPIQDSVEMGMKIENLINKLNSLPYYPILFQRAFGDKNITKERISKSLAQFVRSIVSFNSKYDIGRAQVDNPNINFPNFTEQENLGKNIFFTNSKVNCSGCHTTDLFILDNPRNNGLSTINDDIGINIHTMQENDKGKFKTPSLKSVALRKKFMHNGSILGLDEVINHYSEGIFNNINLDPHLFDYSNKKPVKMRLTLTEKNALLQFLNTLTDNVLIKEEKYSNPFK